MPLARSAVAVRRVKAQRAGADEAKLPSRAEESGQTGPPNDQAMAAPSTYAALLRNALSCAVQVATELSRARKNGDEHSSNADRLSFNSFSDVHRRRESLARLRLRMERAFPLTDVS